MARALGIVLLVSVCGVLGLTAQAPAPSPTTAPSPASSPGKPLRHLEYAFSVSVQGLNSYEFNGINGGVETQSGAGNGATSSGGDGTMLVDVLSVAPDGALVVRIAEQVEHEPRPRGSYTCHVYGNTSVVCPSVPAPSPAEWVLLGYLGRQFIDAAPWDPQGHWQRNETSTQFQSQEAFTLVDVKDDGKKAVVSEVKITKLHNGGFDNQKSDITINYDRAKEVPDVVRDEVETTGGNEAGHARYVFTLKRDSFGNPAP